MFENHRKEKWFFLVILFILALLGILIFWGLNAQANDIIPTKTQHGTNNKKFIPIQDLKTPGGVSVWLVEDHSIPVISIQFLFKNVGTFLDDPEKQGLVRLLSNTMDEGAGEYDSQSFQKILNDHSITLMFNADRDDFSGELVTLTRYKDKAFSLLSMALNNPRLDDEPLLRMRDANISRIQSSLSEPDWIASRILNDKAFEGHVYAKNSGGTLSGLRNIKKEDLKSILDNYFSKKNLVVSVAGDITSSDALRAVDIIFSPLPETPKILSNPDLVTIQNKNKLFFYEKNIPQTYIQAILPAFDSKDPDYYALQIMNYIYGGAGFGSRLMESAREKRGLTYGIYSSLLDMNGVDALSISTSTKNESAGDMLDIIKDEMIKLSSYEVSEKELSAAKSYITGSMPLALKSTSDIAAIALSLKSKDKPVDYLDHYEEKINSVTAKDILHVAKRILNPDSMLVIMVGKPENIKNMQTIQEIPNVK